MIEVKNLTKRYGAATALDDVSFTARAGRVTGFLGPNGAGKSTTMRVLVGLTPATSGSATVDGRPFADRASPCRDVGVLLDASAQHAGRTGREILTLAQQTLGLGRRRVPQMLDLVGLGERAGNRRVRDYSLGMRQRLGVAVALIAEPRVLILDEPANGLDPAGIRWMRDLLRQHADQGGTVLLSSHLLHEIDAVADDLVVIGDGRVVAQGPKAELLQRAGVLARARDVGPVRAALLRAGFTAELTDPCTIRTDAGLAAVGRLALECGVALDELRAVDAADLEDLFLELTGHDPRLGQQRPDGESA